MGTARRHKTWLRLLGTGSEAPRWSGKAQPRLHDTVEPVACSGCRRKQDIEWSMPKLRLSRTIAGTVSSGPWHLQLGTNPCLQRNRRPGGGVAFLPAEKPKKSCHFVRLGRSKPTTCDVAEAGNCSTKLYCNFYPCPIQATLTYTRLSHSSLAQFWIGISQECLELML